MIAHSEKRVEFQINGDDYAAVVSQEFGELYVVIMKKKDEQTWCSIEETKTQTPTKGSELLFSVWAVVRKASKPINRLERKIGDVCKKYGHYMD
jgi:hypothetical protein